jgi:aspartyl-tRNA(Asn)/glutamyl-tRNA(Gln) amidotransferase subunit C
MTMITKDELVKIAKLSGVNVADNEVDHFTSQVQKVLGFVDQLQEVTVTTAAESVSNVNIFRPDVCQASAADSPLDAAPQRQDRYFVVPRILDEK